MTNPESDQPETQEETISHDHEEQEYALQLGWKALFGFTTTSHIAVLISALASATVAAATLPVFSIIYGLIFGAYSDYGAGKVDGDELLSEVTRLCVIMTGVAAASWILNSIFFFLFLLLANCKPKVHEPESSRCSFAKTWHGSTCGTAVSPRSCPRYRCEQPCNEQDCQSGAQLTPLGKFAICSCLSLPH